MSNQEGSVVLAELKEKDVLRLQLSSLQREKLNETLKVQKALMQEGKISPESYVERKEIVEAAFTAQELLNVSHWDLLFHFSSDEVQGVKNLADLTTWSSATCAQLTIYPSFYAASAINKTDAIFHEIIHLYTQPLRRTISSLTKGGSREVYDIIENLVQDHLEEVTNALAVVLSARLGIALFKDKEDFK